MGALLSSLTRGSGQQAPMPTRSPLTNASTGDTKAHAGPGACNRRAKSSGVASESNLERVFTRYLGR